MEERHGLGAEARAGSRLCPPDETWAGSLAVASAPSCESDIFSTPTSSAGGVLCPAADESSAEDPCWLASPWGALG